jgi:sarcosine oxidase subunit gamma
MADTLNRLSPLDGMAEALRRASGPAVGLAEAPFLAQFDLRGDPARRDFVDAVSGALGLALPTRVGAVARDADLSVLALGPDEWLLVRPAEADGLPYMMMVL